MAVIVGAAPRSPSRPAMDPLVPRIPSRRRQRRDYGVAMDLEQEHPLSGGNTTEGVVRLGDTVRKPWEPTTPAVHELMRTVAAAGIDVPEPRDRKSTRLNSSHVSISYAVFCLKKKTTHY